MQTTEAHVRALRSVVVGDPVGASSRRDVHGHEDEVRLVVPVEGLHVLVDELDLDVGVEVAREPGEPERGEERVLDRVVARRVRLDERRQDHLHAKGTVAWAAGRGEAMTTDLHRQLPLVVVGA
jgi:hypothetical protein